MDQSPIQIVEMTPLDRVIEMFKALGLRHLMVTRHGALVLLLHPFPHTQHLTPNTPPLTPHPCTSHLTRHTPHLTPHTPHLTPHTPHLTPHTCETLAPPRQSRVTSALPAVCPLASPCSLCPAASPPLRAAAAGDGECLSMDDVAAAVTSGPSQRAKAAGDCAAKPVSSASRCCSKE